MVGWDVFTKRVFVEKHISVIMCENPGEEMALLAPSADAYGYNIRQHHFLLKCFYYLQDFV